MARVIGGRPLLLRRARGYVPRPLRLARPVSRPVLAVGAQLKNAFCLARGDEAVLGPHVGDLDGLETFEAFEAAVARLEEFLSFRPALLACDLHPLYLTTRWARERAAARSVPVVPVQHHHAHAVAALTEHGIEGPALALCWDGTGLGVDGTAWGGELLLVERHRFARLATFRPLPLAGGDLAIHQPWRIALAAALDAFGNEAPLSRLPVFAGVPSRELEVARRMLAEGVNSPPAHGAGRTFDAAAALALGLSQARFEGQLALALDAAHDPATEGGYPFEIAHEHGGGLEVLDLRPLWRALVADVLAGAPPGAISARFHATLVAAAAELVRGAVRQIGALPLVLSGGCFQNAHLAQGILEAVSGTMEVVLHREVPPGDGGIALGQAIIADAMAAGGF